MTPDPLPVGHDVRPYRIDAPLHQGTAGRFYKAVNTSTQATVAINVLDAGRRNPEVALRLLRAVLQQQFLSL